MTNWTSLLQQKAKALTSSPQAPVVEIVGSIPPDVVEKILRESSTEPEPIAAPVVAPPPPAVPSAPMPPVDEWTALTGWFATATLPTEPYDLGPARRVSDPAKSHGWLREMISRNPEGWMRKEILARLRLLKRLFGETS